MLQQRNANQLLDAHAIVLGGSMAGLLAARVLCDHFARVTLVERDRLPEGSESRRGVPQGRHIHGLLAKGQTILFQLFPDLRAALVEGGATICDTALEARWYHFDTYKLSFRSGIEGIFMSRPFLEALVRQRVLALPNLACLQEYDVAGLIASPDQRRVIGARIRRREPDAAEETLAADLVVDATGRGSQSPQWLEALGYTRPEEINIRVNCGYASRIYRRRPGDLSGARLIFTLPTPPHGTRGGGLFPIEGDRWLLSLMGWQSDYPPAGEQEFLAYARSLPAPDIAEFLRHGEPLSDIVTNRFPASQRRRYEQLERFPEGYLVSGDALCSFNPIYGQGMTVSALAAEALGQSLRAQRQEQGTLDGLSRRFFGAATKAMEAPWMLATGEDFRYPGTVGPKAPGTDLVNWYAAHVHRATAHDPVVYQAFLEVMNLNQPATALFHPLVIYRVLKGRLTARRATGRAALPTEAR
jgi:2-polyprenyl-6-methoxyphenol hydroxylase-like FAD-dependent oxidoreductase